MNAKEAENEDSIFLFDQVIGTFLIQSHRMVICKINTSCQVQLFSVRNTILFLNTLVNKKLFVVTVWGASFLLKVDVWIAFLSVFSKYYYLFFHTCDKQF